MGFLTTPEDLSCASTQDTPRIPCRNKSFNCRSEQMTILFDHVGATIFAPGLISLGLNRLLQVRGSMGYIDYEVAVWMNIRAEVGFPKFYPNSFWQIQHRVYGHDAWSEESVHVLYSSIRHLRHELCALSQRTSCNLAGGKRRAICAVELSFSDEFNSTGNRGVQNAGHSSSTLAVGCSFFMSRFAHRWISPMSNIVGAKSQL